MGYLLAKMELSLTLDISLWFVSSFASLVSEVDFRETSFEFTKFAQNLALNKRNRKSDHFLRSFIECPPRFILWTV